MLGVPVQILLNISKENQLKFWDGHKLTWTSFFRSLTFNQTVDREAAFEDESLQPALGNLATHLKTKLYPSRYMNGTFPLLQKWPVLQHSFYFYFYFEHLWSYLIDTKISWSMILSWSLDLIIWWWSKICFFIWTLHYYLHAFDMPLTHVFHWRLTCILHMFLCNMLLPYTWHALNTHFTCVYLEDNTWTLVYNHS